MDPLNQTRALQFIRYQLRLLRGKFLGPLDKELSGCEAVEKEQEPSMRKVQHRRLGGGCSLPLQCALMDSLIRRVRSDHG
ncbi:MAG: hypothetical protein WAQ08_02665 [Aquabacterium sp.]